MGAVSMVMRATGLTIILRCSDTRLVVMDNQITTDQAGEFELAVALSVMQSETAGVSEMFTSGRLLLSLLNTCVVM